MNAYRQINNIIKGVYNKKGGRTFANFILCVMLCNIFYIPNIYMDTHFTAGTLWIGFFMPITMFCYLLFFHSLWRIPMIWLYFIGLIICYCLYSIVFYRFPFQHMVFQLSLILLALLFSNLSQFLSISNLSSVLITFATIEALGGIGQALNMISPVNRYFPVSGSFDNPAGFATYLAISAPFAIYNFLSFTKWLKFLWFLSICLIFTAICLSASRTGMLGFFLVCLFFVFHKVKLNRKQRFYFLGGSVLSCCLLIVSLYSIKKESADGRLLIWQCTKNMIADAPLIGHGPNSFGGRYMHYQAAYLTEYGTDQQKWLADDIKHPFNEYLLILSEYGLVGFTLFIIGVVWLLRTDSGQHLFPFKISLLALLFCALFSYPFNYPSIVTLGAIISGYLMSQSRCFCLSESVNLIITLPLCVCLLLFTIQRHRAECHWYQVAHRSLTNQNEILSSYHDVYATMQENPLFLYNYGAVLHKMRFWQQSIIELNRCAQKLDDSYVQLILADNYKQLKQYDHAERCLLQASHMCPNRFLPLYYLVNLYQEIGRSDEAIALAQRIVEKPVKIPSYTINKIKADMKRLIHWHKQELQIE